MPWLADCTTNTPGSRFSARTMVAIAKAAADPAGHYSRADAARLVVNRERRCVMQEINVLTNSNFEVIPLEDDIAI